MATITDVSKRAGVSRSTVSRVIADSGYVSESARDAVERAIAELGYRPNTVAQALRSNRTNMIGSVIVDMGTPFYSNLVAGIQKSSRAAGKSLMVSSGYADQDEEAKAIIELVDRACDGLVLYLETPLREDAAEILAGADIPVVTCGGHDVEIARGRVRFDNVLAADLATRYLLERGHRQIVHLSGQLVYRDPRERLGGIAAALADYGMTMDDITVVSGSFSEEFGYDATMQLVAEGTPMTAIFAGDDDIAAGALLALKRCGKRVPEDVSLIGLDDNFHARHMTPALTTIRQPIEEIGQEACSMLLRLMQHPTVETADKKIAAAVVERDSVARVAASQPRKEVRRQTV